MSVDLIDSMGNDLAICNAARVSYGKRSTWEYVGKCDCGATYNDDRFDCSSCGTGGSVDTSAPKLKPADAGLISYLARNRHGTPFEMVVFKFRVRCSIGVAREWQRHRIGSFNEQSTRYVEMGPDWLTLAGAGQLRMQVGKPGHYHMEPLIGMPSQVVETYNRAMDASYEAYKTLLDYGLAKEVARNVLPLGLMTEFIWAVNLRSLTNFLSVRTAPSALLEIRQEAELVEQHVARVVPVAYQAWVDGGRVSL